MTALVHAVVPLKALAQAKSRLAITLPPPARRALVLDMLRNVLGTLLATPTALAAVWVLSNDQTVLDAATRQGARLLYDRTDNLNAALTQATRTISATGATALLVVPADVPLITTSDVAGLLAALRPPHHQANGAACVLAPNQDASGTNALGLTLPAALPFAFGTASFARHRAEAQRRNIPLTIYTSPTLALDIDTPADLERAYTHHHLRRYTDDNHWLCCGTGAVSPD